MTKNFYFSIPQTGEPAVKSAGEGSPGGQPLIDINALGCRGQENTNLRT
jgi:hypothetical protein